MPSDHALRYGANPHQKHATFAAPLGVIDVLNGEPSYTNLLDILTGWQLTRDLSVVAGTVTAASMKHCVPIGLAIPGRIDTFSRALLGIDQAEPATSAYLRARSSDWSAAYGDVAVIFGEVGKELASVLARLVSDGVAATGYTDEALRILGKKRGGRYLVVKINKHYVPPAQESRDIFGIRLVQRRNDHVPSAADFEVVVGSEETARRSLSDLLLAAVAMKYTVSNNIVVASGGRTLSISAGQQSRILSTKLACFKFEQFMRLQHGKIAGLVGSSRGKLTDRVAHAVEQANAINDVCLALETPVLLASDGFIPFKDNVEEASRHGVELICEPRGALRSGDVERAAADHGAFERRTAISTTDSNVGSSSKPQRFARRLRRIVTTKPSTPSSAARQARCRAPSLTSSARYSGRRRRLCRMHEVPKSIATLEHEYSGGQRARRSPGGGVAVRPSLGMPACDR